MDKNELQKNDGKDGKPAYVSVQGKIYDVTVSRLWKNGLHMNRHHAGQDLTDALGAAPHGSEVLQKFKEIGVLQDADEQVELPVPGWIAALLHKYPFLKRHPHPMVVHFPMAFFITASLFLLWYYIIHSVPSLLDSIFYMHILGTISLPFAIITGILTWKVNYLGKSVAPVTRKIVLTVVLLALDIIVLVALLTTPHVLASPQGIELLIPIFIFSYMPIVSIIGQQGGQLVY